MRRLRALVCPAAAAALAGCITVARPLSVSIDAVIPPAPIVSPRPAQMTVSLERFIDDRSDRSVLGYVQAGLSGPVPIGADRDITEAVETYARGALERKGVAVGASPLALRGTIERAGVGAMPMSSTYTAEAAVKLTLVNVKTGARLWERAYGGHGTAGDPQTALAGAFRDALGALEADDSILDSRDSYLASGGKTPAGGLAAPEAQARTSDVDDVDAQTTPRPDDYALVIGIEHYQSISDAQFGERDALAFKRYAVRRLGVPKENVIALIGSKATRGGLERYLEEWLPKNVSADSRVWVYYSGHGAPDPVRGTAYLIPWDGDPAYLDSSAYPVARLYERLKTLKARRIIVMLDSCFSGEGGRSVLAKGARPLVNVKQDAPDVDGRFVVLTASAGDQIAGSLDEQGHGMFTYYMLKGLKGAADADHDGHVSVAELSSYLDRQVPRAARRQNRLQKPQVQASDPGLLLY